MAELVNAIGQSAADHYVGVLHEYWLTVQLVSRIHKEFAASMPADDACSGDEHVKQEIALLMELIPLLGKTQDSWLANKYGLTPTTVRSLRLRLGIMIFDYSGQVPTEELGTMPDDELSEMYGVPTRFIFAARKKLKISKNVFKRIHSEELADERAELIKRLGTTFDNERANEHGVSPERVALLRQHLGISKYIPIAKLVCDRPDVIAQLGTSYDSHIASDFGVSAEQVYHLRTILGIRKFSPLAKLVGDMPEVVEQLGTSYDSHIASDFGVPAEQVYHLRTLLGIRKFSPLAKLVRDMPEVVEQLGKATDKQIAVKFGLTAEMVSRMRAHLGLGKFKRNRDYLDADPTIIEMLKTKSIPEVSKLTSIGKNTLTRMKKALNLPAFSQPAALSEEIINHLGTDTDYAIARRFNVSRTSVVRRRISLGIQPHGKPGRPPVPDRQMPAGLADQLGKKTDRALALEYGVSSTTIFNARQALGVPRFGTQSLVSTLPDEAIPFLGTQSDRDIASRFNVSGNVVFRARKVRGIARYTTLTDFPIEAAPLLGQTTDAAVARRFGLPIYTVREARKQRGIEIYKPEKAKS
jgi:hypothetical protein